MCHAERGDFAAASASFGAVASTIGNSYRVGIGGESAVIGRAIGRNVAM